MLTMTKDDYEKILNALRGWPSERGLWSDRWDKGRRAIKHIKKVYLLTNLDASNEHFSMDPKEQLAAVKDMRANGYQLLGNFHSHPESPSRPSEEDKRLAYDSKVNYLILSLMDLENPVFNAFVIDEEKNVSKEELIIS